MLLKPAAAELVLTLWALKHAGANGLSVDALPEPPRAGLTSFAADPACPEAFYRAYGYHVCGPRAVRLDMLERLADLIRPLLAWRGSQRRDAAQGRDGRRRLTVMPEMMSILGCSPDELGGVLKALGFRLDRRPIKRRRGGARRSRTRRPCCRAAEAQLRRSGAPLRRRAELRRRPTRRCAEPRRAAPVAAEPANRREAAAAAPAEPKFEDIWRPRRHQRGERRPERASATGTWRRPGAGQRRARRRPRRQPSRSSERRRRRRYAARSASAQARAQEDRRPHGKDRSERATRARPRRQPASARPAGRPPPPRRSPRDDRRKAEVHTAAPPRRGGIDPDSPFAALGALRDELAKRGKESST